MGKPWLKDGLKIAQNGVPLLCDRCPCTPIPCPLCLDVEGQCDPGVLPRQSVYKGFRSLYNKGLIDRRPVGSLGLVWTLQYPYMVDNGIGSNMQFTVLGGNKAPVRVGINPVPSVFENTSSWMRHWVWNAGGQDEWWDDWNSPTMIAGPMPGQRTKHDGPRCHWIERQPYTYYNYGDMSQPYSYPSIRSVLAVDYNNGRTICGISQDWSATEKNGLRYSEPFIDPMFMVEVELEIQGTWTMPNSGETTYTYGLFTNGCNCYYDSHPNEYVDFKVMRWNNNWDYNPLTSIKINGVEFLNNSWLIQDPVYTDRSWYKMPSGLVEPGRKLSWWGREDSYGMISPEYMAGQIAFCGMEVGDSFHIKTEYFLLPFVPMYESEYDVWAPVIDALENNYIEP